MNCQFCHKLCNRISDIWHQCQTCNTDFHPHATVIYTKLGEKVYSVKLYKTGPIKLAISSAYQDPMITLTHDGGGITPQNIQQKLKTYLLFS
jgi:hypothetical protein